MLCPVRQLGKATPPEPTTLGQRSDHWGEDLRWRSALAASRSRSADSPPTSTCCRSVLVVNACRVRDGDLPSVRRAAFQPEVSGFGGLLRHWPPQSRA